jgi:hypothetical protein
VNVLNASVFDDAGELLISGGQLVWKNKAEIFATQGRGWGDSEWFKSVWAAGSVN